MIIMFRNNEVLERRNVCLNMDRSIVHARIIYKHVCV